MSENPRRGRQARNFTTNVSKILDLKSSSEQIFFRKLSLGAPGLRCHDGDDNENVKTTIACLMGSCARASRFLCISLPSLHDYDGKMPNFAFYGGT